MLNLVKFLLIAVCIQLLAVNLGIPAASGASLATRPEAALKKAFPDLPVDSIRETDLPGWYEVVAGQTDQKIFYYYPEKEYLFVGDLINKNRQNLTAARRGELAAKLVKTLPLDKAVRIGSGRHVVIEFTDPDCPYCRKGSDFFRKRADVTRYVFFAPLAHPAAIAKIHYILNAKDKAAAYEEMMKGGASPQGASYSEAVRSLAQEHLALARKVGVKGTPTFFVNGQEVVGADERKIEELLKGEKP